MATLGADVALSLDGLQLTGPDMIVDEYEQYNNDRQDAVNISPDDSTLGSSEPELLATDRTYPTPAMTLQRPPRFLYLWLPGYSKPLR